MMGTGRKRWKIEKKVFNDLTNHGYNMKHVFSYDENTIKGYYVIMLNEKDDKVILFTNLDDNEWSDEEIILLYGNRCSIETGYDLLKNKLEMERVTSEKPELILQELYSQVIVHNLAAMIKKGI